MASAVGALVEPEAFVHEPLQSRLVQDVEGKFFVGEHAQGRSPGIRSHFRSFFHREIGILADHRHHHTHHHLQTADLASLIQTFAMFPA